MNIKKVIQDYQPFNEQEEKDQLMMLKYIDTFKDVLTRNNEFGHFTSSSFIVNKDKSKALMIYHNIFDSWAWSGGHCDGDPNFLEVALREANEETGLENLKVLDKEIFAIDVVPVLGHYKHNKYISGHVHLSVAYLFEADDNDPLFIKEDENSGVKWFPLNEVVSASSEPHMRKIYQKMIDKMKIKFNLESK